MRREIDTGLPSLGQPFSWAVGDGPMVYTSHGPVTAEGRILNGDITAQTRLTLDNLRRTMEAAGGSLDDVLQVQLYLLDVADMKPVDALVTYQDSCHLLHGQKIRNAPREILSAIPGVRLKELPQSEICCGSAGTYNIVHDELAASLLESKMAMVNLTGATIVATANPGCMLQLRAGVERHGKGQRVMHVIEVLDEAYRAAP